MDEVIKKRAIKVVDAGSVPLAHFQESIQTNDLLEVIASKDIVIPEEIEITLEGVEYIKGEKGEASEYPQEISISNLPEVQKVEVLNFPEQKAPIVNIEAPKAPVVNVSAPIVEMNNEEVVSELKNISGILSKEDEKVTEKVEIIDEDGEIVDFKKLFKSIKLSGPSVIGGGGGLNQDQLRATLLTTQSQNYATQIDDVSTTSVTYIGKAGIGSTAGQAVWQIQKVDESGSPITSVITWADGNSNFDNIWTNRTSLTYN